MEPLTIQIADLEVKLDEIDTRRLDLPVDAVAERITLRQTRRELKLQIAQLRAQSAETGTLIIDLEEESGPE